MTVVLLGLKSTRPLRSVLVSEESFDSTKYTHLPNFRRVDAGLGSAGMRGISDRLKQRFRLNVMGLEKLMFKPGSLPGTSVKETVVGSDTAIVPSVPGENGESADYFTGVCER